MFDYFFHAKINGIEQVLDWVIARFAAQLDLALVSFKQAPHSEQQLPKEHGLS